jgi:hypothetical protein
MRTAYGVALLAVATTALAQEVKDVRVVNNVTVDLSQVHQWLATHEGQRPLPHWKQIRVTEVKSNMGGWDCCVVKMENGAKAEMLIANLPATVKAFFQSVEQQHAQIIRLRAAIEADKRLRTTMWSRYMKTDSSVASVTGGSRVPVVDNEQSRYNDAIAVSNRLAAEQDQLVVLEAAFDKTVAEAGERLTVLAMFSGREYAKMQVWDCGRPKLGQ